MCWTRCAASRSARRPLPCGCNNSGIYKIKAVGDVLAGGVDQGIVKPGEEVVFLPTHTSLTPCVGKVFTVEMHHTRMDEAMPGDNVGLNSKGLDTQKIPWGGDVMIYKKDITLTLTAEFDAQFQVLDIPGEIKVGYSPIGFVRCGRVACRITKLKWKMDKETGWLAGCIRDTAQVDRNRTNAEAFAPLPATLEYVADGRGGGAGGGGRGAGGGGGGGGSARG
jgi:translation elongation factor EF-1alpha